MSAQSAIAAKTILDLSRSTHEAVVTATSATATLIALMIDTSIHPKSDPSTALNTVFQTLREEVGIMLNNEELVQDARAKAKAYMAEASYEKD